MSYGLLFSIPLGLAKWISLELDRFNKTIIIGKLTIELSLLVRLIITIFTFILITIVCISKLDRLLQNRFSQSEQYFIKKNE